MMKLLQKSLKTKILALVDKKLLNIDGKEVKIILVKNPAGYNQAIDTIMS